MAPQSPLPPLAACVYTPRPFWPEIRDARAFAHGRDALIRTGWLMRAAAELGLGTCRVEGRRLEHVESFPAAVISARAFAPMVKLLALSARFSTQDTRWLLPKGRSAVQEVTTLPSAAAKMFHVEHSVTDVEAGIVIGTGRPSSA